MVFIGKSHHSLFQEGKNAILHKLFHSLEDKNIPQRNLFDQYNLVSNSNQDTMRTKDKSQSQP